MNTYFGQLLLCAAASIPSIADSELLGGTFSRDVITAWTNAGAEVGWLTLRMKTTRIQTGWVQIKRYHQRARYDARLARAWDVLTSHE